MSSRWECNMCSWNCILLTQGGDQPDVCPYFRSGDPEWERIDEEEEEEDE